MSKPEDAYARAGVDEDLVKTVADALHAQLDRNFGDCVNYRGLARFVRESGLDVSSSRAGMVFRDLERNPRYGIEIAHINPDTVKTSYTVRRSGR